MFSGLRVFLVSICEMCTGEETKISIQIMFLSMCPNFVNISSQSIPPPRFIYTIFSILDIYTHIGIAIYVFFYQS